jgi:hypothetical protein
MKNSKQSVRGQNWSRILKEAGIPESPGYVETVRKLYSKEVSK